MIAQSHPLLRLFAGTILVAALFGSERCAATEIYVDNRVGSDTYDGASSDVTGLRFGPVKTIGRALQKARQGDTIIVANRGVPYYEQLSINGRNNSGFGEAQFTIVGNGAIVSGARLVPPTAWKAVVADLWRFVPHRKGHFQLILDDKPVPEMVVARGAKVLPKIPTGQWAAWRGAIYFQAARVESPSERAFAFAEGDVGLTLAEVHDVVVVGLTFRHFRLDGVSAHSQCRNVVLKNVSSTGNGRAGLFVGETSRVEALKCTLTGNRLHNVLVRGRHSALHTEPKLSEPPTFID
ncbi:MAG: right-handed parallel beta-helix repeat-containing protein [Planctomycetaceae bacterium]|jgi:hypothetical protein|nr:right-handed parallel beta-helix repeat-containing protein [Planctomycetaceae bacterium]MBT6154031.1 right-handed parallel beta-helix repeat-containing protein [Planctomycetaceae bacterium]MBT6485087.1 right-handed parallel beta-helix repeat-containing protein [Planctomycetaceae bacterium]MBT6495900.1 right-handed parallel beta-helix repeat-containing protein [Planctomycetaceae bacterium]